MEDKVGSINQNELRRRMVVVVKRNHLTVTHLYRELKMNYYILKHFLLNNSEVKEKNAIKLERWVKEKEALAK